jgi:hypothetical protein
MFPLRRGGASLVAALLLTTLLHSAPPATAADPTAAAAQDQGAADPPVDGAEPDTGPEPEPEPEREPEPEPEPDPAPSPAPGGTPEAAPDQGRTSDDDAPPEPDPAPEAAGQSEAAEGSADAAAATCVARVGTPADCRAFDGPFTVAGVAGLPPGLELTADGRIVGTPTSPGITNVIVTAPDRAIDIPVVVSDVDYVSAALSSDGRTLRGTRWDGTTAVLHQGLIGSDVRGVGIHPDGSVYLLTHRTLFRIERPGQVAVVLEGLESEGMDIAANGDVNIASRKEVLTYLPAKNEVLHRYRGDKILDVIQDDDGDLWLIEIETNASGRRHLRHIDARTGLTHEHDGGSTPRSLAANRGFILLSTETPDGSPTVIALDHGGQSTQLLDTRYTQLHYSDAFGLLATDGRASTQIAWGAPFTRTQLAEPVFSRVAVAQHLRFTAAPRASALVEDFHAIDGKTPAGHLIGRVRTAHSTAPTVWSMPGDVPQHGVRVTPEGELRAVERIPLGRHQLTLEAHLHGVPHRITVFVDSWSTEFSTMTGSRTTLAVGGGEQYPATYVGALPRGFEGAGWPVTAVPWESGEFPFTVRIQTTHRTIAVPGVLKVQTGPTWTHTFDPQFIPAFTPGYPVNPNRSCPATHPFLWGHEMSPGRSVPRGVTIWETNGIAVGATGVSGRYGAIVGYHSMWAWRLGLIGDPNIRVQLHCVSDLKHAAS